MAENGPSDPFDDEACRTPGAVFHVDIAPNAVTCSVDLPQAVCLTGPEAKLLENRLHDAFEGVLAEVGVGSGHDEQTEDLDVDLLRSAAQVLNDNYLAGSQGARWDELEESEQEHWITAVQAVLVAAFGSSVSGGE
jgi:hypothetical protein